MTLTVVHYAKKSYRKRAAAKALGLPENKVVTKVKRLGGGFGGKESRATLTAVICALAASKINRPVRLMLDRDEDIAITGGRHPSLAKYKIAFTNTGRILAIDVKLYVNCGYAVDFSDLVLERAMVRLENAYDLPAFRITGYTCKTNLPSNTAFRGFGGPQATFVIESIMQQVAFYLHKDLVEVSEVNLCKENDLTICGQELTENNTLRCWQECMQNSDYYERRKVVEKFNRENRYKKMGLCVTPLKFGVGYVPYFLNQGGALVLVYTDGSVLLSHGGVEMGQGLHTKMMQVASQVLEIPMERIHVSETSTDKIPNTTPTAASCGSDINGAAVLHACQIIKDRLKPYRDSFPNLSWEEWVKKAYFDRVNLAAVGFYDAPHLPLQFPENLFGYFTYGAGCCQVEIDTLTGDHRVHRVDIVMDLGESLNPAIDIGQIEGGFMQGYGLFVMEEMVYSPRGAILTKGPGTYKIPSLGDIPREFNVSLLKGSSNSRAVYSSKAVGEPPLLLGCSVALAITDAIKAARLENGINANFQINAPVTAEKIRMACEDSITVKFKEGNPGSFKPWNVVP